MDWTTWAQIGEALGGLAGVLLNTLLLAVTLWLAVWRQPKKDRELEASQIIAWPAETYHPTAPSLDAAEYYGVVVANPSPTTAQNVGIRITPRNKLDSQQSMRAYHALGESLLPPGTWFIPIQRTSGGIDWKLPIPVRTTGTLRIQVPGGDRFDLRMQRSVGGSADSVGAFTVHHLEYTLRGFEWWRDEAGVLHRMRKWTMRAERRKRRVEFDKSSTARRVPIEVTTPEMRRANASVADRIKERFETEGVNAIRNTGSGVYLYSRTWSRTRITLAGSRDRFPNVVQVYIDPPEKTTEPRYDATLSKAAIETLTRELGFERQYDLRAMKPSDWDDTTRFEQLVAGLKKALAQLDAADVDESFAPTSDQQN